MNLTLTLGIAELDRTENFYREVLGLAIERWQPAPQMPEFLLLKCGDAAILFRERFVLQSRHPTVFEALDRHPPGQGLTLELPVSHLSRLHREIERRQYPVLYELQDDESGWQELWLRDPDGYLLIFSQAPE